MRPARSALTPDPLRLVCVYQDGSLPSRWFRFYQRLRRQVGTDGTVDLLPAGAIPDDTEVLVIPSALKEAAQSWAVGPEFVFVPENVDDAALTQLLERLRDEGIMQRSGGKYRATRGVLPRGKVIHKGVRRVF